MVAQIDPSPASVIELVETLREVATLDPAPRPLLEEALRRLRELDARGELPDKQKAWIGEIETALAALP